LNRGNPVIWGSISSGAGFLRAEGGGGLCLFAKKEKKVGKRGVSSRLVRNTEKPELLTHVRSWGEEGFSRTASLVRFRVSSHFGGRGRSKNFCALRGRTEYVLEVGGG